MATDIVGSNMPADNKYGQNGYAGASSDLPGKRTRIDGFSNDVDLASAKNGQTRDVGTSNVQPAFGMKRQTKDGTL